MRHVHSSGRFDAPIDAMQQAMLAYVERDDADVITTTEANKDTRRRVLRQFADEHDWYLVQAKGDGPGNCAILVDSKVWKVVQFWSKQLTEKEQRRGPGGPPPAHSITARIRHRKSGVERLVSVAHLPSHVEGDWFRQGAYRVMVWHEAVVTWRRHIRHLKQHYGSKRMKTVLVADWNLNMKRRAFRLLLRRLFPELRLTWHAPFPAGGTHHTRLIDATLTDLDVTAQAHLLPDDESADHRPYAERLG